MGAPGGDEEQGGGGNAFAELARIDSEGRAEVFRSEGSGRISGLAWADGLVEIGDEARVITPGDPVRYIPYASFR